MICVSLTARSNEQMLRMMELESGEADMLELRLDGIKNLDLTKLLEARTRPVIVTCRPADEGGKWKGSESARLELLGEADALGAEYIDIELDASGNLPGGKAKRIVSFHDFDKTPDDLSAIHEKLVASGADVAKIAVTARSIMDNLAVFKLLKERGAKTPTIALCMGEHGVVSRIASPLFGGYLTFAAASKEGKAKPSAPGQLTTKQLCREFRYRDLRPTTRIYGVIGKPIAHSLSPLIHNAAFNELHIDALYLPFLVDDIREFVPAYREIGARGFSVTIPHKEAALECAEEVDELAARLGAANTLYESEGKWRAANTDCSASVGALERALGTKKSGGSPLANKNIVVMGAGGAARAMVFGLVDKGAKVVVANRTYERGAKLAEEASAVAGGKCHAVKLDELGDLKFDVICNLTSIGMHPNVDESPVPAELLKPKMVVFDAVYNPLETKLIRDARESGCSVVPGLDWFIGQAAEQFRLWTGQDAPEETMRQAALARLG